MSKYLNQLHSFQKLASWMRNVLTLLDRQILMTRLLSPIQPKILECEMKICTVPVHGTVPIYHCNNTDRNNLEGYLCSLTPIAGLEAKQAHSELF